MRIWEAGASEAWVPKLELGNQGPWDAEQREVHRSRLVQFVNSPPTDQTPFYLTSYRTTTDYLLP